jgi:uncharacterized membrane protein YhaH (DUF805 family)
VAVPRPVDGPLTPAPPPPPANTWGIGKPSTSATNADFVEALRHGVVDAKSVKGRTSRKAFWYFAFTAVFVWALLTPLMVDENGDATMRALWSLVVFLPVATAAARRMHDVGKPGYWVAIALVASLVTFGLPLLVLIYFLAQPGVAGDNPYGPPSRGPSKRGWW